MLEVVKEYLVIGDYEPLHPPFECLDLGFVSWVFEVLVHHVADAFD